MEELILRYYLKVFSIFLILLIILYYFYSINKKINLSNELFTISKNQDIESIFTSNDINLTKIDIISFKIYFKLNYFFFNKFYHYGNFKIKKNISVINLYKIISKPSNVLNKITIVEGWSHIDLNYELSKYFNEYTNIPYEDIIADTYYFNYNDFESFLKYLKKTKKKYFKNYNKNILFNTFNKSDIMIIGSLIEKEGSDIFDKKKISSVIFNRLTKKMKLQIDATVIYAITDGKYNLNRKLLLKDLKIDHPYNTYVINSLPPKPISYVGKKTLDLIFDNYSSDFLFYFYNNSLNRHIFSKSYAEHRQKLNDYRNKQ